MLGVTTYRKQTLVALLAVAALALPALAACSDDDSGFDTQVTISGDHSVSEGATLTLQAETINGTDAGYTWASDDETVATVDENGVVTGVAAGEAEITATGVDSGVTGRHAVVVTTTGGGDLAVIVSGDVFMKMNTMSSFTAETVNGTDSGYTWTSSDETVATVDATTGEVHALTPGAVTITAEGWDTLEAGSLDLQVFADIPNHDAWAGSGHADYAADAFRHWDEDGEVSASCARCHGGSAGYRDYLGDDGTTAFQVDSAAPLGGVVDCNTCHNPTAQNLSKVIFPSGVELTGLGPEARCMTCHQGRESGDSVVAAIDDAGATGAPDTVDTDLGFLNIHYYAAGATLYAGEVRGGYQYADQTYDWRFRHVPGYQTCDGCHDAHTLEVKVSECADCHTGVATVDDLEDVRMMASVGKDYDGDGDTSEGVFHEIEGLRTKLYEAIQGYASETSGADDLCYDAHSYPYWFIDTDGSGGTCDAAEASYSNQYATWTPRLLRATYNYQTSLKDPGAHAHNAKYMIQLLFDSITDLNTVLGTPVDMANAVRNDFGHFDGASAAARHWDEDAAVSASCSKCHSGSEGFRFYLQHGVGKEVLEQANGLDCATCHNDLSAPTDLPTVAAVTFPGEVSFDLGDNVSNLCGTCHGGRESTATVNAGIARGDVEFYNVHYLPAAGVRAGTDGKVGYEYSGMTYSASRIQHGGCDFCHDPAGTDHSFLPDDNWSGGNCSTCHGGTSVATGDFRLGSHASEDYDGDGTADTLADEVSTIAAALMAELQDYATNTAGAAICYDAHSYPYWFNDNNVTDGTCDSTEASYPNAYGSWDETLVKAAFNYQVYQKEPGAWAHNLKYIVQILIDSIDDLGGAGTAAGLGFTRPTP